MNQLLNSFISGFWHILNQNAIYHLLFVLLLLIVIDIKKWVRIIVLISLFSAGFYISVLLNIYQVININYKTLKLLTLISILVIAIANCFELFNQNKNLKNTIAFGFGIIHGLSPLKSMGTTIKRFSLDFVSALFASIGIWAGLILFIVICALIITLIQFISKVSRQNVCSVFNVMALFYTTYLLLIYYNLI